MLHHNKQRTSHGEDAHTRQRERNDFVTYHLMLLPPEFWREHSNCSIGTGQSPEKAIPTLTNTILWSHLQHTLTSADRRKVEQTAQE